MTQTKKLTREEMEFVDSLVTQDVLDQTNVVSLKKFAPNCLMNSREGLSFEILSICYFDCLKKDIRFLKRTTL